MNNEQGTQPTDVTNITEVAEEQPNNDDVNSTGNGDHGALAEAQAQINRPGSTGAPGPAGVDGAESADVAAPDDAAAEGDVAGAEGDAGGSDVSGAEDDDLVVRSARDPRLEELPPSASMEDLLRASEEQYRTLRHGEVVEGTIMKVDREEILVDIGAKTEGIIPSREAQSLTPAEREALKVGDQVLVVVVQPENAEGHAVLSLDRARQEKAWRDLQKKFEAGEIIEAQVIGHNKGGLLVNVEGLRGFVPASQISSLPPGEANKQAELARYHGRSLPLKIIEINRNRNRLILSERQAVQEQREAVRQRLLQELQPGQIVTGTVTSIADFGAFVDIGGADGLIHLSELSWKRVSHPSEVLKVGDRVNVQVLSVDPKERKIALSLKRTQPEPWETISEQYHLGQVVKGTITQITSFGAFARLEDGIEGLIHVSELAEGRVAHPRNVVKEGDVLDLKVIRIDPARKRIGLSLKRMKEEEGREVEGEVEGEGEGKPEPEAPSAQQAGQPPEALPAPEQEVHREAQPEARRSAEEQSRPPAREPREERREDRRERTERRAERGRRDERGREREEEPMGALAQALAAHVEATGLGRRGTREVESAEAETPPETPPAPEPSPLEPETETPAPEAEAVAQTPEAPEALMPASAETETSIAEAGPETTGTPPTEAPATEAQVQPQPDGEQATSEVWATTEPTTDRPVEADESDAPSQVDTGVQPAGDSLADVDQAETPEAPYTQEGTAEPDERDAKP
jgi:small subunit ribosomal protein S1